MTKSEKQARAARARALLDLGERDVQAGLQADGQSSAPEVQADKAPAAGKAKRQALPVGASQAPIVPRADAPPAHTLEHLLPRKWQGDPPQEGDLVFHRGERFWVEPPVPLSFADSVWIRIGDHRVPKPQVDPASGLRVQRKLNDNRNSFYVHVDELSAVPPEVRNVGLASRLPTMAGIARAERAKAGIRDIGDEVAALLRACDSLEKVYSCAGDYLGVPASDLRSKYGHLNPGQQRMNLGNRMRAKWRKEHG